MAQRKRNNRKKSTGKSGSSLSKFASAVVVIILGLIGYFANEYFGIFDNLTMSGGVVDGTVDFHFIDVGQGDSILIMTESGNIFIDAGPTSASSNLNAYLDEYGVKDIEYAIFTHPHEDHIGSAASIIKSRNVKNVIMPDIEYDTKTHGKLLTALEESTDTNVIASKSGDVYTVGDLKFKILAPNSETYKSTNDYSIVIKAVYGSTSFILTGDAEVLSENEILNNYSKSDLKCDVLKVGHHGSTTSSGVNFLDAVNPSIAVISCATGNDYGHPHKETLEKLNARSITIYRTDLLGSIVLTTDGTIITKK